MGTQTIRRGSTSAEDEPKLRWQIAQRRVIFSGDWTLERLAGVGRQTRRAVPMVTGAWRISLAEISGLDTAGAVVVQRLCRQLRAGGASVQVEDASLEQHAILKLAASEIRALPPRARGNPLERLGRRVARGWLGVIEYLAFIGRVTLDSLPRVLRPQHLRWHEIAVELERAGVMAIPIIGLLAFLIGIVMAYQSGDILQAYGANVFLVDLLGVIILREMGPLMTAVIVAGRTGSAYTAQIATMQLTEEIDALRTMGVTPFEILVLPKMLALVIALPLLTLWADAMGLLGGMLIAHLLYGVDFDLFLQRLPIAVPSTMFWLGIVKAPVFAALIASIGCYQGFKVRHSADEVGRYTTISVVQGIFWVIVADAVFSIAFFSWLGL
ncbi:MAG: ABC transporter permease [Nitrococcus sp.]|nr:ABC transporter permease [Nitrococcus sp.]